MVSMTPAELASQLRPALLRLTRLIRNQRVDMSVTLTQLSALATLRKHGPMSAGELAGEREAVEEGSNLELERAVPDVWWHFPRHHSVVVLERGLFFRQRQELLQRQPLPRDRHGFSPAPPCRC